MSVLPIVRRELLVAAGRKGTYRQRVLFAVGALLVALLFAVTSGGSPAIAGGEMFRVLSWGAFLICLFEGIRVGSDALARERREGTLGLLFLTDLRGYDIVLGKLSATAIRSFSILLAMLPVFALPLLLGGVTSGESWRVMLALMTSLFFAISAGLLVSSVSVSGLAALGGSLALVCVLVFGPLVAVHGSELLWLTGPLGIFLETGDSRYQLKAGAFWRAVLYSGLLSVVMLAGACGAVTRFGRLGAALSSESWWRRLLRPRAGQGEAWGGTAAAPLPAVWLADRTLPGRQVLWFLVITGGIGCFLVGWLADESTFFVLGTIHVLFGSLIKLWIAAVAPQSIHAARQSGALELLLCTPLRAKEIVRGQIHSLTGYFFPPALVVTMCFPLVALLGGLVRRADGLEVIIFLVPIAMGWFVMFVLDLYALAYAGLWFGLSSARAETAIAKTAAGVLLLPLLTLFVPLIGCLGLLFWPVFWIVWASNRLNSRFHAKVTEQFAFTPD